MITYTIALAILVLSANCFIPNLHKAIPDNTLDFDYSPDQKFIALMTPKSLNIYYAQSLKDLTSGIIAQSEQQFRSFAFSSDSMYLAIGLQEGNANLYKFHDGLFEKYKTFKSQKAQSLVNDICFLGPSKIVFAINENIVAVWDFETGNQTELKEELSYFTKVSCSPINESQFMGISGVNANESLNFYNFNEESNITRVHQIDLTAESKIYATAYSKDGTKLYAVGKQKIIYSFDIETLNKTIIINQTIVDGELRKVRVSDDEKIFAVASTDKIFIFTLNSQEANVPYVFPTPVDSVALTGKGGHVFYVEQKLKGVDLGACPEREFYEDEIGKCQKCTDNCDMCWYNATECFICKQKFYVKNNQCSKCSTGCLICSDDQNCLSCDTSNKFQPDGTKCKCMKQYFLDGEICSPCSKHCLDCTNSTQCKDCKNPYILKEGACTCDHGTYDDGSTCKPCIAHCQICTNGTQCKTCLDPFTTDQKGLCICKQGTYPDGQTCLHCMDNCLKCQNATQCLQCKGQFVVDEKGGCSCKNGTYYDGQTCAPCIEHCEKCQDDAQCQQCFKPYIVDEEKHVCTCQQRKFDDGTTCKPCIDRCQKCTNEKQCQVCDYPFVKDDKGICSCSKGQFDDGQTCQPCLLHCQTCSNATYCDQCYQPFHDIDHEACICEKRKYDDGKTCSPCIDHCQNCKNGQKCEICDPLFEVSEQGVCVCKKGTFLDGNTCSPCLNGCLQCQDGVSCQQCDHTRHFVLSNSTCQCDSLNKFVPKDTECVCIDGTFLNNISVCTECNDECTTCTSEENCTKCKGNQTLIDGKCSCPDLTQFYDPAKHSCVICNSVIDFCQICDRGDECMICNVTTRYPRSGSCMCRTGSYEDSKKICQSCDVIDGCLDCTSANVCKQCNFGSGWKLNETTKQCQCQQLYYRYQHHCILCEIDNCIQCLEANKCSKCSINRKLQQNKCLCADGYYQNKTDLSKCQQCSVGCNRCNDGDSCMECNQIGHWIKSSTLCQCDGGFYQANKTCHNCSQKYQYCLVCTINFCNDCKGDLKVIDNQCKCASPKQYQDKTSCLNCSQNCQTCTLAKDRCLSCAEGQYLGQDFVCYSNGSNLVLIIIVVVAGVVALGIIGFVISRVIRARRIRASLTQDYSQIEQNREEMV